MILRVIVDEPAGGAWNMAVDQALLESVESTGSAVLRIYCWRPATLSLGYFQSACDRQSHSASLECPVVRRASGGGAIIHDNELTYSLCLPSTNPWSRANSELYESIHRIITEILADHSVTAESYADDQPTRRSDSLPFLCFQRRYPGDLIVDGHKVVGSAQRRARSAILQHGSILLARSESAPELPGISDIAGSGFSSKSVADALIAGVARALELTAEKSSLTDTESNDIAGIMASRFGNVAYTNNR